MPLCCSQKHENPLSNRFCEKCGQPLPPNPSIYESDQTYRTLLDARKRQGLRFSEVEVRQLLLQILPVLEYIHSMGVIHQDISPDNLILRSSDCLPLLTNFGLVKQVAATVTSQSNQQAASTPPSPANLVDKLGYAPYDQMQTGMVAPHSDLYALAATVLVLLTSKEPQELIEDNTLTWNWQGEVNLSPTLGAVLDKMLLPRPSKRYQSARQVLQALSNPSFVTLDK
jgi:serine/threonine-protein kinase